LDPRSRSSSAAAAPGQHVIEAEDLRKGFGNRLLIDGLSFKLPPGGIVGVIGPNGAGKTTLFKMITGKDKPDAGTLKIGDSVRSAMSTSRATRWMTTKSVWQEISGGHDMINIGKRSIASRAYAAAFNFKGGDQQKPVGVLSGGERNRVHLAKMLRCRTTSCCSTSRPTTSTSIRCARSKRR
jgi:sulfate-transporting ATPase